MLNAPSPDGHGYAVFGKVVEGMAVVDKIKAVATGNRARTRTCPPRPCSSNPQPWSSNPERTSAMSNPQVELHVTINVAETATQGVITLELDAVNAPKSTANFLAYVNKGHYDGTIFHRVIKGFMIQGGGFTADMKQKGTDAPIENEAANGLKNDKYTIAMARTGEPHSATAQFFINTVDNGFLNHTSPTPQGWGYAVFGKVVKGEDVVESIKKVRTTRKGFHDDVPFDAVVIDKAVAL